MFKALYLSVVKTCPRRRAGSPVLESWGDRGSRVELSSKGQLGGFCSVVVRLSGDDTHRALEDNYRTLDINDKFDTVINISRDENNFELFKGYEGNDGGLIKFKSDFLRI